ncbi:hypothetical protein TRFO_21329 [Tritrichomonas foetus]|uniref:Uncharacterized protein n=1 Tax=Tritrichomonas foetus TaxID=1144522 RepID=A0A1J4KFA4_9EUKA|nr:hypothetical protein TRFO_21329 [Tritrichomonas foetus]|eukprot:OHT09706.1 hypothetical protein TRFO_21329 [Tritrichomonas foetus]
MKYVVILWGEIIYYFLISTMEMIISSTKQLSKKCHFVDPKSEKRPRMTSGYCSMIEEFFSDGGSYSPNISRHTQIVNEHFLKTQNNISSKQNITIDLMGSLNEYIVKESSTSKQNNLFLPILLKKTNLICASMVSEPSQQNKKLVDCSTQNEFAGHLSVIQELKEYYGIKDDTNEKPPMKEKVSPNEKESIEELKMTEEYQRFSSMNFTSFSELFTPAIINSIPFLPTSKRHELFFFFYDQLHPNEEKLS